MQGSELKAQKIAVENTEHFHLSQKTTADCQDHYQSKTTEVPPL